MLGTPSIARTLLALVALAIALVLSAAPAQAAPAARTVTITRTEAQINSRYWVTNPQNRSVSERSVDLQPGQVVISQTVTLPRRDPVAVTITLVPALADGRVTWTATAATVNGEPASVELLAQINERIGSSWARFIREQLPNGRITAVTIDDSNITFTAETDG